MTIVNMILAIIRVFAIASLVTIGSLVIVCLIGILYQYICFKHEKEDSDFDN